MVLCLTSVRFNMKADILRGTSYEYKEDTIDPSRGEWVLTHDPDSNEIIRKWVPAQRDDPSTPDDETQTEDMETFRCIARSIIDGGIRVAGTTERFGPLYEGVDYVRIFYPASVQLNRRDRVTNIRDSSGKLAWKEDEAVSPGDANVPPTVFNVMGSSPVFDPFGKHIENFAMLERVETQ